MDPWREWKLTDQVDNQRHPQFKFGGSFVAGHGGTDDMGKMARVPEKDEKGEPSLGPMVTSGWKSKDYSAPAEESVSLVGKSTYCRRLEVGK